MLNVLELHRVSNSFLCIVIQYKEPSSATTRYPVLNTIGSPSHSILPRQCSRVPWRSWLPRWLWPSPLQLASSLALMEYLLATPPKRSFAYLEIKPLMCYCYCLSVFSALVARWKSALLSPLRASLDAQPFFSSRATFLTCAASSLLPNYLTYSVRFYFIFIFFL